MAFSPTPLKPKGKSKFQLAAERNRKIVMTEEQEKEFIRLFPTTFNVKLMKMFGLSHSTLHRIARRLQLHKDNQAIHRKHVKQITKANWANGHYDSLKGKAPSQACLDAYRKKLDEGFNLQEYLKENFPRELKRGQKKATRKREEARARDRRRVEIGLSQLTKFNLPAIKYTRTQLNHRYNALKRGYILGSTDERHGERMVLFYDKDTTRNDKFEKNCIKDGFRFNILRD